MKVIIKGHWSDCVGTDYCEALGVYDSLEAAQSDADSKAWDMWEPQDDDNDGFEVTPDYYIEEYIPGENGHDMLRAGGGSFEDDFN